MNRRLDSFSRCILYTTATVFLQNFCHKILFLPLLLTRIVSDVLQVSPHVSKERRI